MKNKFCLLLLIIINPFLMSFEGDMHDFHLSNGLKVIIYEKHTYPTVAFNVVYDIGSHDDPLGKRGLAHVMSKLMWEGSNNYKQNEHRSIISSTGGSAHFNRWKMVDYLEFSNLTTADHFELLLKLEADRMSSLLINSETVTNAVNHSRTTLKKEMESSFWEVEKAILSVYANDHPYSYSRWGNIEDIENISVDDCQQAYDKYFTPNNAILVIVGDIDPVENLTLINKYFGSLKPSTNLPQNPNLSGKLHNNTDINIFHVTNWPMKSYIQAYSIPSTRNKDILIIEFISTILTLKSSHYSKIVSSNDDFMDNFLFIEEKLGNGLFAFVLESDISTDFKKHEKAIVNFIGDLKKNGIENSFIKSAIKTQKIWLLRSQSSSHWMARALGEHEIRQGDYKKYTENAQLYEKITNEDIKRVANQYFINGYKLGIQPNE